MSKFFSAFLIAFFISYFFNLFFSRRRVNFKKETSLAARKIHQRPISHLGGVALFLAITWPILIFLKLNVTVRGLLTAGALIFILGLLDDTFEVTPTVKFFFQALAAIIAISAHIKIGVITWPFLGPSGSWLNYLVTFFWLIGITNAFNLIDGLDGLAGGVAIIASVTLAYVAASQNQPGPVIMALGIAGASLGFLRFNFFPARIFMGDSGSLFLGFLLAILAILVGAKKMTFFTLIIPVVILGLPIMDTLLAILRRYKNDRPLFKADRQHLHHRLLAWGISQKKAVLILYSLSAVLSLTSIIIAQIPPVPGLIILGSLSFILFRLAKKLQLF